MKSNRKENAQRKERKKKKSIRQFGRRLGAHPTLNFPGCRYATETRYLFSLSINLGPWTPVFKNWQTNNGNFVVEPTVFPWQPALFCSYSLAGNHERQPTSRPSYLSLPRLHHPPDGDQKLWRQPFLPRSTAKKLHCDKHLKPRDTSALEQGATQPTNARSLLHSGIVSAIVLSGPSWTTRTTCWPHPRPL